MEKFKNWFQKNLWFISGGFIVIIVALTLYLIFVRPSKIPEMYHKYTSYEIYNETNKLVYDSIKLALLNEVDGYILGVAPTSSLSGLVIINNCLKYDIDICFVLSQAEQESHFGTHGLARKTNSVFNVYAFDGHDYNMVNKNGKYDHPNDCVEPYLRLLKRDYLVDGKTEYDLMLNYVNKNGSRYASSETYEEALQRSFAKIKSTTNIDVFAQELNKYKLMLGIN